MGTQKKGRDITECHELAAIHKLSELVALVSRKLIRYEGGEFPKAASNPGLVTESNYGHPTLHSSRAQ